MAPESPPPESKRKTERIPFPEPLHLRNPVSSDARGVDISAGGVAVELSQAIAEGSQVELELFGDGAVFAGTVRMVRPLPGGGFRLGIQFQHEDSGLLARAKALRASAG